MFIWFILTPCLCYIEKQLKGSKKKKRRELLWDDVWHACSGGASVKCVSSAVCPSHFTPWYLLSTAQAQQTSDHLAVSALCNSRRDASQDLLCFICLQPKQRTDNLTAVVAVLCDVVTWNKSNQKLFAFSFLLMIYIIKTSIWIVTCRSGCLELTRLTLLGSSQWSYDFVIEFPCCNL